MVQPITVPGSSDVRMDKLPGELRYVQYEHRLEHQYLPAIRALISKDLSEPYSIYVYRYFLCQWSKLCFMALHPTESTLLGVVICKLEQHVSHSPPTRRGYIAMLAVASPWRGLGIATALVRRAIDAMAALRADEVVLETEETNSAAMRLYERLGFLRSKKLHRYYLNGSSAYRLVLLLRSPLGGTESEGNDDEEELFDADEDLGERYADDSGDPMVGIGSGERSAGDHGPRRLTLEDDPARAAGRGRDGGGGGSEGGGAAGAGPMQSTGMVGA